MQKYRLNLRTGIGTLVSFTEGIWESVLTIPPARIASNLRGHPIVWGDRRYTRTTILPPGMTRGDMCDGLGSTCERIGLLDRRGQASGHDHPCQFGQILRAPLLTVEPGPVDQHLLPGLDQTGIAYPLVGGQAGHR